MSVCPALPSDIGIFRDILGSVDCNVQFYSAAGYRALTGPTSPLPAALTAMMTIYVALLGYRMLFAVGGGRLADTPLIALKIGAILTVTLNWGVFQTLVFNVDSDAPLQIGRVISRPMTLGSESLASDPIRGLQTTYDELTADAAELSKKVNQAVVPGQPAATPVQGNEAATATDLRRAAAALLASTAGVLSMSFIATGVLTAVGPLFVALFLFDATRGFFVGWVRALVGAMLAPMVCWIASSLLLVIMAPRIDTLAQQRASHQINLDAAASASAIVLIFAGAQLALVLAGVLVAGGFRLGGRRAVSEIFQAAPREPMTPSQPVEVRTRAQVLAASLQRSPGGGYTREFESTVLATEAVRAERGTDLSSDGSTGVRRLGETYRRGAAMRERDRQERTLSAVGRA